MEPEVGGVRGVGMRPGHNRGRYPVAVPGGGAVAGDITNGGGKGRGKVGNDFRTRGGDQSHCHTKEPHGPFRKAGPTVQQSDRTRGRHVAGAFSSGEQAGPVPPPLEGFHPMRPRHVGWFEWVVVDTQ